jgi:hypoxanthine-guanine phosphoribosyltransferase
MPKAKLTFVKNEAKKVQVAGHFSGVEIKDHLIVGDELHLTVSYRDPQNLVKMARMIDKVTGTELDAPAKK